MLYEETLFSFKSFRTNKTHEIYINSNEKKIRYFMRGYVYCLPPLKFFFIQLKKNYVAKWLSNLEPVSYESAKLVLI